MSLYSIQLKQQQNIETELIKLLDLLSRTEQYRDVIDNPIDRAKYELEINNLKSSIERYKSDLQSLENEIKTERKCTGISRTVLESYRARLDDSLMEEQLNTGFAKEVKDLLDLMEYEIASDTVSGLSPETAPTFIAIQESDFEPLKILFQCSYGILDENTVMHFKIIFESNQKNSNLNSGIIITNTYIAPSAWSFAKQYQIQLVTFEDLLNTILKVNKYLKAKCQDYEKNNNLYRTYVEVKYLRREKGRFKDNQATSQEFPVSEAADGSSFEAKGDLTPYVDNWVVRNENSQICLLGEYGTGKTSFATHYFYKHAVAYLENPLKTRIPLLVTLNRYHKSADIEQMMTDFLVNECGIRRNFNTFLKLASRGKLLIILDGFDEMAKQVDSNVRRHNFKEISRLLVGYNKVILSGRPNYFLSKAEIDELFNQESQVEDPYKMAIKNATLSNVPRYEILTITQFDRWQIEQFIKNQSEYLKGQGIDDWRELQKIIYETYNLEELARTPVLLEIIIKTISNLRGTVSDINAAKLYEIYTDYWLNREDEKGDVRWLVNRQDKELFVLNLAWTMLIMDSLNPEIHFSKLSEKIRNYFNLEKASEIEYFSSDIRFCSFLTHSKNDGNYKFIHKSFMEYFAARWIYKALFDEHNISLIVTYRLITDEIFFFLCQMIVIGDINLLWKLSMEEQNKVNKVFIISLTAKILQQLMSIYEKKGAIEPTKDWADRLLQYSDEFDFFKGKLWGFLAKGKLNAQLGRYDKAKGYYQKALNISEQFNDRGGLSQSLMQLGTIYQYRGDLDTALQHYQQSLNIFEEIGDRISFGQTLINIGSVDQSRGELDKALHNYQLALSIFEEISDRVSIGQTLIMVGDIYQMRGEINASLEYFQEALAIFKEIGVRRSERLALFQIGSCYQLTGRYDDALQIYQTSLAVAHEIGDQQGISLALSAIGNVSSAMGRVNEAEQYYQKALLISEELDDQRGVSQTLVNIGQIYQKMDRYEEAVSLYQRSVSISESLGDMRATGFTLSNIANVYCMNNRLSESIKLYKKSLNIFEKIGDERSLSQIRHQLGMLLQKDGDFEQAENYYRQAIATNQKIGDVRGEQSILKSLGDLAEARQDLIEAERLYTAGLQTSIKIDDQISECEFSVILGKLAKKTGDTKKTIGFYARYLELAKKMNLPLSLDIVQEYDQLTTLRRSTFIIGSPALDERFYGRDRELGELYRRIQRQENVMLIGQRRIGKTSLLYQLHQRLELPFVSVFINLESFFSQANDILNGIIKGVVQALLKQGLLSFERWGSYSLTYTNDFEKALESILDEAKEKLKYIKIVLILDEAEQLLGSGEQVGQILRATLSRNRNVVAILAGTSHMEKISNKSRCSPLLNIFTRLTLQPFSREDTEILICEISKQVGVSYEPSALNRIYQLSGGIPLLVQSIGSILFELAVQENKNTIALLDINENYHQVFENLSFYFSSLENQLNEQDKAILSILISGGDDSLKNSDKNRIFKLIDMQIIVKEDNNYRFMYDLLKEWFRSKINP